VYVWNAIDNQSRGSNPSRVTYNSITIELKPYGHAGKRQILVRVTWLKLLNFSSHFMGEKKL